MIVISDTSPLRYLIETDLVHILEALFGKVTIPLAVLDELPLAVQGTRAEVVCDVRRVFRELVRKSAQ